MQKESSMTEAAGGDSGAPHACWSCHGPITAAALFCHVCGAVQPSRQHDAFARLGFPGRFEIDAAEIDKRYRGLQQRLHPDRFTKRSPRERAIAESQAMSLNDAYETLKDPLKRAALLLERAGRSSPIGENRTIQDPALLMEAMEVREALAAATDLAAVEAIGKRATAEDRRCIEALGDAFEAEDLDKASHQLTALKYWRKLAEEIRGRRAAIAHGAG